MRDKLATQLAKTGYLALIRAAAREGRPRIQAIAPGAQISHFLYKSRANVQFCMSSLDLDPPVVAGSGASSASSASLHALRLLRRRRLMSLYHELHAAVHARHAHLRVLHAASDDAASLAWVTPAFELYCVAGPNASRAAMAQAANRVAQWARREEERLFIIGGGVF